MYIICSNKDRDRNQARSQTFHQSRLKSNSALDTGYDLWKTFLSTLLKVAFVNNSGQ